VTASTDHIFGAAGFGRRRVRTATIACALAIGICGLLLSGCGGSSASRSLSSLASAAAQQGGASAQQAASTAHQPSAGASRAASSNHRNAKGGARRGSAAKARSPQAARVTQSHSSTGSQASAGPPLVPKGPNPCVFVSGAEAQAIIGTPIVGQTEAPLGPTCVFKLQGQRQTITISVQTERLSAQVRYMHKRRRLLLGGHRAFCGILGRSMLDVALGHGRILNVTAPCPIAEGLASRALRHIAT
jgi:hypothetical protein